MHGHQINSIIWEYRSYSNIEYCFKTEDGTSAPILKSISYKEKKSITWSIYLKWATKSLKKMPSSYIDTNSE